MLSVALIDRRTHTIPETFFSFEIDALIGKGIQASHMLRENMCMRTTESHVVRVHIQDIANTKWMGLPGVI
jgi:hypothetical protein